VTSQPVIDIHMQPWETMKPDVLARMRAGHPDFEDLVALSRDPQAFLRRLPAAAPEDCGKLLRLKGISANVTATLRVSPGRPGVGVGVTARDLKDEVEGCGMRREFFAHRSIAVPIGTRSLI